MAFTQADIDTLKAAIASGVSTVSYADRTVTYQNLDSMLKALALMEKQVNPSTSPTHRLAQVSKGV